MSMLAGPRRKQKFTLNPRGKHWSEDPNKFGQKMLEKMGWSAGKGLGAKEQGMVEHVRVKVKNDQLGIGYKKNKDDHWTEHQDVYNSLLQNLQKEQAGVADETEVNNKVLSGKSLEEKSKQSQKRVHYKKFTRGKDVNKYSTKDLANIFGKKDLNEMPIQEIKKEEEEEVIYDPLGSKDTTGGVLTVKGGNMNDYFKNKFYGGQQNGTSQLKDDSDDECEERMGFGYTEKSKSKFYVNDNGVPEEEESDGEPQKYVGFGFTKSSESKTKSRKRMDLNYVYDNPCLDLNILDNSPANNKAITKIIDLECSEKVTPKKRKSEFSYDNGGLDLNCINTPTPKKRKSEHSYENGGVNLGYTENYVTPKKECTEDVYEIKEERLESSEKRKSKRSKKIKNEPLSNGIENPALDLNAPDRPTPKKCEIKSKPASTNSENLREFQNSGNLENKPRIIKDEIISNGFDNLGLDINFTGRAVSKKIKIENDLEAYENPALDLDISDEPTPNKRRKIKNGDSSHELDNPGLDESFPTPAKSKKDNVDASNGFYNPALDLDYSEKTTPKKLKKCKKEQKVFNGLENPALDLEDRPTPKKPKRSKDIQTLSSGLENPALDLEYVDGTTPKKSKKSKTLSMMSNEFINPGLEVNKFTNDVSGGIDYEISRTRIGLENNALDLSDESSSKKRVTFNDQLEYNTDVTKKKKKKKRNALDKYEVVTDKLKKKRKHMEPETTAFVNEGLDLHIKNEEEIENEMNERKSRKNNRKRERRISLLETIEEAPEDDNSNEALNVKNKEDNKEDLVINENVKDKLNMDAVENEIEAMSIKKSKKKKKAKKDVAEENVEGVEVCKESNEKKKKKKIANDEPLEVTEVDSPEKENKFNIEDKTKKTDDKKIKKKSSNDDVVSLEEFLNEEEVPKGKQKSKNQSADIENCTVSEKIEVAVSEETNENSYPRFKKTKQVMKSLFMKNPTLMFKGSNINEIRGYGSQFNDNC